MTRKINRRTLLKTSTGLIAAPFVIRPFSGLAYAKAPMLGRQRPSHYRFRFGDFEITTINDGAFYLQGPYPVFGADQFPEDVEELAVANHLSPKRMEIGFTPVIINTGRELILFDTGNGDRRRPNAGKLAAAMKLAGYSPDQVDVVVITHFHADHIGGLMEDGKPAFPNARYVTGEREYDFWMHEDQQTGNTASTARLAKANVAPLAEKTTFLKEGSTVVPGITAMEAFGHTPGHMTFHIESAGQRIFLGADFANHYVASLMRPEWHVSFDVDKENAARTRVRILKMLIAEKIPFTSYHMPFPSVGYVERKDEGFVYIPASYQFNL